MFFNIKLDFIRKRKKVPLVAHMRKIITILNAIIHTDTAQVSGIDHLASTVRIGAYQFFNSFLPITE